jgi:hypothetical protein
MQIRELARRGGLSHAWLLVGPEGMTGKSWRHFWQPQCCAEIRTAEYTLRKLHTLPEGRKGHTSRLIKLERLPDKRELLVDQIREWLKKRMCCQRSTAKGV